MTKKRSLKILFYFDISLLLIFIFYKVYLLFFERDFQAANIININKLEHINKSDGISFCVLGNIKSSLDIFDKEIVKKINSDKDLDFAVSTGNAVIDGEEDKYRVLNKSLNKLMVPTILGIGDKELTNHGSQRFYKHYGPFYFSYSVDNAYFIFLDTTGETSEEWQQDWLIKELNNAEKYKYKFIFMNKPPFKLEDGSLFDNQNGFIEDDQFSSFLSNSFTKYKVTAVFASGSEIYSNKIIDGVEYFISGGAGGSLILNNEDSFYHYIKVSIKDGAVSYKVVKPEMPSSLAIDRILKNAWFYIHAIFYLNFFRFILILSIFIFFALIINRFVTKSVDYYREFDEFEEGIEEKESLNVAMFTNNYLPFIGGVPISITRLAKGLRKKGHNVVIFAPKYPQCSPLDESNIIRCKLLLFYRTKPFDFPITNIFSSDIEELFLSQNFDIIHVHHPFWMGSKGLSLGKKYGIPVILTYHTRLEKYAHNLPCFRKTFENVISHRLIRAFSQKCQGIIAPTNSAKEYLSNIGVSKNKYVLPTGVDFDFYNNSNHKQVEALTKEYRVKSKVILCTVSRLTKEKNIYFLLKGIKYIKDNCSIDFKCLIIGDGPEKNNILKIIEEEELKNIVILVGSQEPKEVCNYYRASDIFIFSSQSETQGMVLLEAMAGYCPIVAIRSSGTDDVIINDYNGFKTKADVKLWSEKVIYLMENAEILKEMSQNAYDFSRKYSIDAMAEMTVKAYYEAIAQKKNSSKNEKASMPSEEVSIFIDKRGESM